jgi:hypothetical protein
MLLSTLPLPAAPKSGGESIAHMIGGQRLIIDLESPAKRKKFLFTKRKVVSIKGNTLILKAEIPLNDEAAFLCSKKLLTYCIKPYPPALDR